MKRIAIITGATSGVGREFARQLDGAYYGTIDEMWLVARDADRLREVSDALYAPCRTFALDLCDDRSFTVLADALSVEKDARVLWLVNSAGFGFFGDETLADPRMMANMVRLNCLAVVQMCELALPHVTQGSRIVNMASVAAYLPIPGMGLYAATKRFVLDVTRVLNDELAGTGVHACAVCPKAMRTGFWHDTGDAGTRLGFSLGAEEVFDVVRKAIDAVNAGRGSVITAPDMQLACAVAKALPYGALSRIGARAMRAARAGDACATGATNAADRA